MKLYLPLADYRGLFGTYLRPQRGRVALMSALLVGSIGLQLLNPQIIRYFIDTAQSGGPQGALLLAAATFIGIGLAQRALDLATAYTSLNVGWNATNALRTDLAGHLLRLDMPFHKTHTPGELIERVDGDVTETANFLSEFAIRVLSSVLLVAAVLALLYLEDWRAGLALTIYTGVTLGALAALHNFGTRRWAAFRQASAEQFGFIEERLAGTEDIRAVGAEDHVLHGLYSRMRAMLVFGRRAFMGHSLSSAVTNFLFVAGYALGLALGAYLYTQQAVSIGGAFLIVYYIGMLAAPLENLGREARDLQQATASIGRVFELFRLQPTVREAVRATLPAGPLSVAFESVIFAYEDGLDEGLRPGVGDRGSGIGVSDETAMADPKPPASGKGSPTPDPRPPIPNGSSTSEESEPVLREVSFEVQPGRVLGVLGRTGSGKTSMTRLLFRLYDPNQGAVRLGGVDVRELAFDDLRDRVGMVTQDVQLFQASIRDNIDFFSARDEQVKRALAELGIWDWVAAMPQGLDTTLAEGGAGLSAGEAQLLAFTRVFLKDPGLVILDEAAARLDPITERRLERAVDSLFRGRTGIVIAHRLRTVQRADDILILEAGRVVEYGPREQLAADPQSRFYSLLRAGLEEALV
jgi:ABC-type multidrug transport system fused ATPase/permease subunit